MNTYLTSKENITALSWEEAQSKTDLEIIGQLVKSWDVSDREIAVVLMMN